MENHKCYKFKKQSRIIKINSSKYINLSIQHDCKITSIPKNTRMKNRGDHTKN